MIEDWIAADELELGDDGLYRLSATVSTKYDELLDRYVALVKDWNKFVGEYIAVIAPKDVGRPLAASDAQVAQVLKLRKEGTPYRLIVDETGLGLQTVRTIIGRKDRTDRTTKKRMERTRHRQNGVDQGEGA